MSIDRKIELRRLSKLQPLLLPLLLEHLLLLLPRVLLLELLLKKLLCLLSLCVLLLDRLHALLERL
jgi:hypothetical protein